MNDEIKFCIMHAAPGAGLTTWRGVQRSTSYAMFVGTLKRESYEHAIGRTTHERRWLHGLIRF